MSYISNTKKDLESMLKEIGVSSIEELFADIPEEIHLRGDLDIPLAIPEHELVAYFREIAAKNKAFHELPCFIGAGSYFHYVPAVVKISFHALNFTLLILHINRRFPRALCKQSLNSRHISAN